MSQNQDTQKSVVPVDMNVITDGSKVVITFSKEISWIALTPEQAIQTAEKLKLASVTLLRSPTKSAK